MPVKTFALLVLISILGVFFKPEVSVAACSADALSDCQDAANDALKKASETSNPVAQAKAAGEAVGTCVKCATEELGARIKDFGSNTNSSQEKAK